LWGLRNLRGEGIKETQGFKGILNSRKEKEGKLIKGRGFHTFLARKAHFNWIN